jgi:hypothetical protein
MNQRKVVVVYHNQELTPSDANGILEEIIKQQKTPVIHIHPKTNVLVYPKRFYVSTYVLNFNIVVDRTLYVVFNEDVDADAYEKMNDVLLNSSASPGLVSLLNTDDITYTNMEFNANIEMIVEAITMKTRSDFLDINRTLYK